MLIKHEIFKVDEKYYDKFPAIKLVTSTKECPLEKRTTTNREIMPRNHPTNSAYCKQLVLFRCRYDKPCELPYTISGVDYDSAAAIWYTNLTKSNSPEERIFSYNEEFLAEVKLLDFDYFDESVAQSLKDRYSKIKGKIKIELDAEQIELDEEPL